MNIQRIVFGVAILVGLLLVFILDTDALKWWLLFLALYPVLGSLITLDDDDFEDGANPFDKEFWRSFLIHLVGTIAAGGIVFVIHYLVEKFQN